MHMHTVSSKYQSHERGDYCSHFVDPENQGTEKKTCSRSQVFSSKSGVEVQIFRLKILITNNHIFQATRAYGNLYFIS